MPYSSLIERIMENDFNIFINESCIIDDECDMNFNRIETFEKDSLLYRSQEIIQRDWYFNSPLHYMFSYDVELDVILKKVMKDWSDGIIFPEAERILKSMQLRFIER